MANNGSNQLPHEGSNPLSNISNGRQQPALGMAHKGSPSQGREGAAFPWGSLPIPMPHVLWPCLSYAMLGQLWQKQAVASYEPTRFPMGLKIAILFYGCLS